MKYDPRCTCSVGNYNEFCPIAAKHGNHPRSPVQDGSIALIGMFRGKFSFLSSFHPAPTVWDGIVYPTSEHAYHAAKTYRMEDRQEILRAATPAEAKRLGRYVNLRVDWTDEVKTHVMFMVVLAKFLANPLLRNDLLATGQLPLIEGNTWGDTFWGQVNGEGQNRLGKILVATRSILRGDLFPLELRNEERWLEKQKNAQKTKSTFGEDGPF